MLSPRLTKQTVLLFPTYGTGMTSSAAWVQWIQ
jgi:hypothetical protein